MKRNQNEVIDEFIRSGWKKGTTTANGFTTVWKRDPDSNYVVPDYIDLTIFPNGRYAEGTYRRYPTYRR